MPVNLPKVANTAARGAARNERQKGKQGPFDVWTNTGKGIAENTRKVLDDPVGTMKKNLESRKKQAEALGFSQWESTSHSDAVDAFIASAEGVGDAAYKVAEADGALATFGAAFGTVIALEQTLSVPFSVIPFPALPAVRVTDTAIGLPHAHMHPPNLIPPNPVPVPLPSAGPVIPIPFISGAATVLINMMPAGRCGDMGLGIWCGGYFPMYEIFLGSSSVWLEGARAARVGVDITKHCIFTTPKPSDPPVGPMVGATVTCSANVIIGGVPLPSLTAMAAGKMFKALFKGLGKLKGLFKAADDVAEEAAEASAKAAKKAADEAAEAAAKAAKAKGLSELDGISKAVNPLNGDVNCGKIIDAVVDRLKGKNPNAVAPRGRNGGWDDIGARHGTEFKPSSFDEAYDAVAKGGDGSTSLVGIHYPNNGGSHVVVITNNKGAVGIIEGQGGGAVHKTPSEARNAYGAGSTVTRAPLAP
jgi:uncharacterized Zn-binding protein involved in type VI secretion